MHYVGAKKLVFVNNKKQVRRIKLILSLKKYGWHDVCLVL